MLDKSDLSQIENIIKKNVRAIVREEVENEARAIKDDLRAEIKISRMRIQNDIDELKDRAKNVEIRLTKVHKDLKEDIKKVTEFLDKENMQTRKRVISIKHHLNLPNETI